MAPIISCMAPIILAARGRHSPSTNINIHPSLMRNHQWMATLNPNTSLVVQIGANDHNEGHASGQQDAARAALKLGWRGLLYEPERRAYRLLAAKYEHTSRIRVRNAASCPEDAPAFNAPTCDSKRTARMWHVDTTNATGNWGSPTADVRCITGRADGRSPFHFVLELSSFSQQHVTKHAGPGVSYHNCALCAAALQRPLGSDCLKDVIWKNLRPLEVSCACIGADLAGERSVELLVVDAEGHDDHAIAAYPLRSHPPRRIIFEPKHMPESRVVALGNQLRASGYECQVRLVNASKTCPTRGGTAIWHLISDVQPG
eukprot:CAMPEP_0119357874 /NCGR_PEP_ID=MMETSP1334-20130426/6188_1 /TAXON_ID=127549 /ORGANISM="Calcidiscus leptoporus, Strain RCC1130" /LENGTH=315 /DNA_ID=CAMNT_0007372225 /DNA_START=45 /DNA_END=992 /DNA_ORIENTATION=+